MYLSVLDELGTEMDRAGTKIDGVMKKIARITNLNDGTLYFVKIYFIYIIYKYI